MASGAVDEMFRNIFIGCISSSDAAIERRPYHKNCGCGFTRNLVAWVRVQNQDHPLAAMEDPRSSGSRSDGLGAEGNSMALHLASSSSSSNLLSLSSSSSISTLASLSSTASLAMSDIDSPM